MANKQNQLDAMKSEIELIKKDMKDVAAETEHHQMVPMLEALALMTTLLEKMAGPNGDEVAMAMMVMGLDSSFQVPVSWMDGIAAAYKKVYQSETEASLVDEDDLRDAIESCTNEGMLHPRFDGYYQFAPHTQWKSYQQRQTTKKKKKKGGAV